MNPGPQTVTIVLIEDEPGHARLIESNIRRAGVNNPLRLFPDGASALAYLFGRDSRGGRTAAAALLVLLDLNLPDMSGTEILRRIKSDPYLKRTPVVILTTTESDVEIARCYENGCNAYITKPIEYDAFANAIRQLGLFLSVIKIPEQE